VNRPIAAAIDRAFAPHPPRAPFWEQQANAPTRATLTPPQQQAARLMNEALVLLKFRQFPAALPLLEKASKAWPTNPDILFQYGSVLLETGQLAESLAKFNAALVLRPKWSDCLNNKSAALSRMGRIEEAVAAAEAAVAAAPNAAAYANLCAAYSSMGDNDRAVACGEQGVRLSNGTSPMALINYGVARRAVWDLTEGAGAQERAIQVSGGQDYMAWSNLGAIRNLQGRNQEALAVTQRAHELNPQNPTILSNMIMYSDLLPETTLIEALCRRRHWAYLYEAPLKRLWKQHENDRDPGRRLRVGYVGADFRQHSAAHIHGAVIRAHDPEQVAVYVYAGNRYEDRVSALIREAPALAEWVTTSSMSDLQLADRIWADRIDILVDCASFTSGGRLITFACKPAPIQATAWGYANGTGLDAMDLFLADGVIVPPQLEHGYSETVVRMSNLLTFDPFLDLPPPGPPPRAKNGYVTFGSYNRVEKISPPILQVWAEVMKAVPDSRIVLKFGGLQGETAENLVAAFEHWGIARERVECRGHTERDEHLRQYGDIDIMLDTWPHVGGITTLEALWMGVPCVTLLGPRAPSRVSASILTTLGMTDWIAESPEQYLEIARAKCAEDLSALRAGLPDRVKASVIGDTVRYTRELEGVYREAFKAWVERVAPAGEGAA
jgi:protein O-GlcNAc transferase